YDIEAPGRIAAESGRLVAGLPGYQLFDQLAVDADGYGCGASIIYRGITSIPPDGSRIAHFPTDAPVTPSSCFGGCDLRSGCVTLSSSGRLVATEWPRPGLALNFLNRRR